MSELRLSKKQIAWMRKRCQKDLVFLANVLGFCDLAAIHDEMAGFICSSDIRKMLCGFRSSFKSCLGAITRSIQKVIQPDGNNRRILLVYSNLQNAAKKLRVIKNTFEGNMVFRALFSELIPSNTRAVKWSEHELDVAGKDPSIDAATFTAMGVGGQTISGHYTDLVLDDIVAPEIDDYTGEEILPNREAVEKAIGWFKLCDSLLIDQSKQEIMILCNRWFNGDHYEYVENLNKQLPDKYKYSIMDSPIVRGGIPTFPERYGIDEMAALKASKGSYLWASQYLCSPTNAERQVFRQKWFKYYDIIPDVPMKIYMTIDRAGSRQENKRADYTVIFIGGIDGNSNIYAIHYDRGHYTANDTITRILSLCDKYKPLQVGIEQDVLGQELCEGLKLAKQNARASINIVDLHHKKVAKAQRISALQPYFENGRAYFRTDMGELETELLEFSLDDSHRHDDILDCWAYFLKMARPPIIEVPDKKIFENPFTLKSIIEELGCEKPRKNWNPAIHKKVPMEIGA